MTNNQKFFTCLCCGVNQASGVCRILEPLIFENLCDKCYPVWGRQKYIIDPINFRWLGHGLSVKDWIIANDNTCKCEDKNDK